MPKVFISYSWSNSEHQERVRGWADRLLSDGVEVIIDVYDTKEGDDLSVFMESMVTDDSISHVLIICDKKYTEKANKRERGVGIEAQIISEEVYKSVKDSKFIPIICEFKENGDAHKPAFLAQRKYIDFSNLESINQNWEVLLRAIYNKPLHPKPAIGKPPLFLLNDTPRTDGKICHKFLTLQQAIVEGKRGVKTYRESFLDECMSFADSYRIRSAPETSTFAQKVYDDCVSLTVVRDRLTDWILLEGRESTCDQLFPELLSTLERILELKTRPPELTGYDDSWFQAHGVFAYETFLYIIAALIRCNAYELLHEVFHSTLFVRDSALNAGISEEDFSSFFYHSTILNDAMRTDGGKYISPAAEFVKRNAHRQDIPFNAIMQAEALILLVTFVSSSFRHWLPGTLFHLGYERPMEFFYKAKSRKHADNLLTVTGVESIEKLQALYKKGEKKFFEIDRHFRMGTTSFKAALCVDDWGALP